MLLTKQQRAYADARMSGLSITESALAAGCPAKSAAAAGSRLEKHPKVQAVLGMLKDQESAHVPGAGREGSVDRVLFDDPLEVLTRAMNGDRTITKEQVDTAKSLMPYFHAKLGDSGKKEQQATAAESVVTGRFAPAAPPSRQLKLVN